MEGTQEIDPRLLEILVCPLTKAPLRYDREAQELISEEAGLAYPIRDGIPIMLVDYLYQLGVEHEKRWRAYLDGLAANGLSREPAR